MIRTVPLKTSTSYETAERKRKLHSSPYDANPKSLLSLGSQPTLTHARSLPLKSCLKKAPPLQVDCPWDENLGKENMAKSNIEFASVASSSAAELLSEQYCTWPEALTLPYIKTQTSALLDALGIETDRYRAEQQDPCRALEDCCSVVLPSCDQLPPFADSLVQEPKGRVKSKATHHQLKEIPLERVSTSRVLTESSADLLFLS